MQQCGVHELFCPCRATVPWSQQQPALPRAVQGTTAREERAQWSSMGLLSVSTSGRGPPLPRRVPQRGRPRSASSAWDGATACLNVASAPLLVCAIAKICGVLFPDPCPVPDTTRLRVGGAVTNRCLHLVEPVEHPTDGVVELIRVPGLHQVSTAVGKELSHPCVHGCCASVHAHDHARQP